MYILDIEASGLGDESYPIEIAWCKVDGDDVFSSLINPESAGDWYYWDDYAEMAVHGISREECCEKGVNIVTIARQLEMFLAENAVFSDAAYQDQIWVDRLFGAVGRTCPAKLMNLELAVPLDRRAELNQRLSILPRPHRAHADCLALRGLVRNILGVNS